MDLPPFCGREAELLALREAWDAVRAGWGPQVVVVLGERGLGKTRLVQEFFDIIATRDGDCYWTPGLAGPGNSLQVNPLPDPARTGGPPFLWWGLRLPDPAGGHDPGIGTLAAAAEAYLAPQVSTFRREARRKDRRREALAVGKGVALDFMLDAAIDLIPFGGLARTVTEAGADLHRIWREDREEAAATGAGSLVGRLLEDLALVLAPETAPPRPAVIILDDAHHAGQDPGISAFTLELMARARRDGWPLLLVLTHWEREWATATPDGLAARLRGGAGTLREVRLAPLPNLGPVLDAGLPGLLPDQRAALLDRADGNPRFLVEIVLFARGARGLFVGGAVEGPLTERGLARLLERSTTLHELTAARLRESPAEVQDAVCLASLQGVEFLNAILGGTADRLGRLAAVDAAERPHAYVRAVDTGVAAFAQRIYYEVAAEHLENCFDPDEARQALEDGVRALATGTAFADLGSLERRRFLALAAALFEAVEPVPDRMIAASCLHHLARIAEAEGDLHSYRALARRLDALIQRSGDEVLDGDLDWLRLIYFAADGSDALEVEARVVGQMCRLTAETFEEDDSDWARGMHARALALLADHHLNRGAAAEAVEAAVAARQVVDDWPLPERSAEELVIWAEVYGVVARALAHLGLFEPAIQAHEVQMLVAERMIDLDPENRAGPQIRAFADDRAGRLAWEAGDRERAVRHFEAALARRRAEAEAGQVSAQLPMALCHLARVISADRPDEAAALRAEAVTLARDLVARSDDADHRHTLAWALLEMGRSMSAEPQRAAVLGVEAAALIRPEDGAPATEQAALTEGFAAAMFRLAGRPEEALSHALRACDRARRALGHWPSPGARRTHLAALIQLARIEQALGDYGSSAFHLGEAQAAFADCSDPGHNERFASELRTLEEAQPTLH